MQLDNRHIHDLDYLAERGFEKIAASEADLAELKGKIKQRSFSLRPGLKFGFISVITGAFLGISVFFTIYNSPKVYTVKKHSLPAENKKPVLAGAAPVSLDTLEIMAENFTKAKPAPPVMHDTISEKPVAVTETAETIEPITSPELSVGKPAAEQKIKYVANYPIKYVHDLKASNYYGLYFKKNKLVALTVKPGIDASYANKQDYEARKNVLEPERMYYLHEAFEDALLLFKKRDYNACIQALNTVMVYSGNDVNCYFYKGMCYYYKNNCTEALKNFEACITNENNAFLQEAEFYKAQCLYKTNKEAGLALFKKIAEQDDFYAEKARQFLSKPE